MSYENVPRVSASYQDGFFDTITPSLQPKVLVLGTASYGRTDSLWRVGSTGAAAKEFKNYGTLTRGMFELIQQGSDNIVLRRLPTGTPGVLKGIGVNTATGGAIITTVQEDAEVGERYALWFEKTSGRIAIYDNTDEAWIYDTESILAIDTGIISVTNINDIVAGQGTNVGSASSPVNFEDVTSLSLSGGDSGFTWTAGTDGTEPSLMELYEALDEAYEDLDWNDIDFIVPMGVYLNSLNVADMESAEISDRDLDTLTDYPTTESDSDVLGKLYKEEYLGKWYYWWDTDADGEANIFPSVGSADATHTINGTSLTSADFHEVNFAYQAAEFCRIASTNWHTCIAFIGVTGPASFAKSDLSTWIGDLPDYTEASDGTLYVAYSSDNGTGLLGNKFLAGSSSFRSGAKGGGFIQTDTGFLDGTEEVDNNDHVVDIGKHINIVFPWVIYINNWINPSNPTGKPAQYIGSFVTTVAAKYATLPEKNEANGPKGSVKGVRLAGIIPGRLLNKLLGVRYIGAKTEAGIGVTICGSKTAARTDSDWTKISTIRSANRELQGLRTICVKYLGEAFTPDIIQSMQTGIDGFLKDEKGRGYNNGANATFLYTVAQRRLGQLTLKLRMVPPFAIEAIDVEMSLSDDESNI